MTELFKAYMAGFATGLGLCLIVFLFGKAMWHLDRAERTIKKMLRELGTE